ncbi:MAG: 3-phosphoshikimate 1-carboxyvinyltransferase [Bacteroidales bacterium]|nr:3-phosphoshikimate 1-carboxyvinyltransferase [Bacteroidales bacterium]
MICTSIQNKTYDEILAILDDPWIEMAEIRLDRCDLSDEEIEDLFANTDTPLIATCRIVEVGAKEAERRLGVAIRAGARFADLEVEADAGFSKRFRLACEECGTEIIRSFHDYSGTPDLEYLQQLRDRCYRYGADIAKIVVTAHSEDDVKRVMALYDAGGFNAHLSAHGGGRDGARKASDVGSPGAAGVLGAEPPQTGHPLVAFAMGDAGRETRIECLKAGAPFSYACLPEEATAPGQIDYLTMHREVYGDWRGFFRNSLQMPASKSFAQRAIIAAALADGRSHLRGYSPCDDSESALAVARALGAKVRVDGSTLTIDGIGGAHTNLETLHTGESGLLTRLMIPLMATINDCPVTITGEKTLTRRPLKGVSDIMASFGVIVRESTVPMRVDGRIIPGVAEISGKDGSQLISGLLTALPLFDKPSTLIVTDPKSIPYMFITCDVLKRFGIKISSEMEGDEKMIEEQDWSGCTGVTFKIRGGQKYHAADFDIEGDWSSAAPFLVAGALYGKAEVSGLDTSSLQADLTIADILVEAGAVVSELDEAVCVSRAPLEAFAADLNNAPDIFPIVSVLAAFCAGESVISGVGRLVGKESNRCEAILEMLSGLGVEASVVGDDLHIVGETLTSRLLNGRLLRGGAFTSRGDHRMAMALKIASFGASEPIAIDDTACVAKSFPGFWEMFD